MENNYYIVVKTHKGEVKTIFVSNSEDEFNKTTILAFKEKILEAFSYTPDQIRIICHGSQLEDTDTFAMRKIKNEDTFHLCLRLRGGQLQPDEESKDRRHSRDLTLSPDF
ncbi:uncharacterized protein LOC108267183 isoform X2 [Ictalurus punctatus]|uniref:Uncharacterized protein LOC108267183 isoform X2 n=1 Tax=Ictalurus punctatus TaxID=7998 RepID=A0A2D0R7U8_ICTPU|nr:uncharacterized protein LOC108267183 isoform X2 [Ictalurus punctatus]